MRYQIEGGSLPAVVIQLDAGETIMSELAGRNFPVFPGMPPQTALLISQLRPVVWRRFLKL